MTIKIFVIKIRFYRFVIYLTTIPKKSLSIPN